MTYTIQNTRLIFNQILFFLSSGWHVMMPFSINWGKVICFFLCDLQQRKRFEILREIFGIVICAVNGDKVLLILDFLIRGEISYNSQFCFLFSLFYYMYIFSVWNLGHVEFIYFCGTKKNALKHGKSDFWLN